MSFEEEWAALKRSSGEETVHTRLNGPLPPDGAGPGAAKTGLHISRSVLRAKAGDVEELASQFLRTDNEAIRETRQVKAGLRGFECATAFDTFDDRWAKQMKYVRSFMVTHIAKKLRNAAKNFKGNELRTETRFRGILQPDGSGAKHGS